MTMWILVGAGVLGLIVLAAVAAPLAGKLGGLQRAAARLQRRQAEAMTLQASAETLQESVLALQARAETMQERLTIIRAATGELKSPLVRR